MRKRRATWIVFVTGTLLAVLTQGDHQRPTGIDRVAWLQGCWEMVATDRTVEEYWMRPRGMTMLGMSRTLRRHRLVDYELLVLREEDPHVLSYQVHPAGQPTTVFLSSTVSDSMVVFENPEHDFPQQIGYLRGHDSLLAWIEGPSDGQVRRIEFAFRRARCP